MINNDLRQIIKDYGVECTINNPYILYDETIHLCGFSHSEIEYKHDIFDLYEIQYTDWTYDVQTSVMTTDTNFLAFEILIDCTSAVYIHKQYVDIDEQIINQYNLIYNEIKKVIPANYQIEINMFRYNESYYKIVHAWTKDVETYDETINIEPDMVLINK